jgi:hypothetical protein
VTVYFEAQSKLIMYYDIYDNKASITLGFFKWHINCCPKFHTPNSPSFHICLKISCKIFYLYISSVRENKKSLKIRNLILKCGIYLVVNFVIMHMKRWWWWRLGVIYTISVFYLIRNCIWPFWST